jgi:hypothetical protein
MRRSLHDFAHPSQFSFQPPSTPSRLFCRSRASTMNAETRVEVERGSQLSTWFHTSESDLFPTPLDNVKVILPLVRFDYECRDEGRSREGDIYVGEARVSIYTRHSRNMRHLRIEARPGSANKVCAIVGPSSASQSRRLHVAGAPLQSLAASQVYDRA